MKRILLVDDDPVIIDLVKRRLEKNNYEVLSAQEGELGVRIAQEEKPDLIVMDVMIPNVSGGDAVRMLKADQTTKDIPVIFLTAVTARLPEEGHGNSINVDGRFYPAIAKPFQPEKFLLEVKKQLGENS